MNAIMRNAFAKAIEGTEVVSEIEDGSRGPVQEEIRKRYQGYRTKLTAGAEVVETLILSGKLPEAAKEIGALSKAVRYVGNFGKDFLIFANRLQSFVEEKAADGERISNRNLVKIQATFEDLVERATSRIEQTVQASVEPEVDPTIQLQRFEQTKTQLVKELMDTGYVVAKAPVVIVTTPFLKFDEVKKHFNAETFEGYVILKRQMVIGVTPDFIKQVGGKKITKKDQKLGAGHSDRAIQEVLDVLREKYPSQKYIIAGTTHERFRAAWVWVMPDKDMALLQKCTSSGNLKIDRWDLSFSGS